MRHLLALLLLLNLSVPALSAPLCLQLELTAVTTPKEGAREENVETMRVVLGDDYLEIDRPGRLVVYDFAAKRIHVVQGKNYERFSLYSDIGFRSAEARNLWALYEGMTEAKVTEMAEAIGDPVTTEHKFSVDDGQTQANLSRLEKDGSVTYSHKSQRLAQWSLQGQTLSPAQSLAYVRFVRYFAGGHPDILKDLQAGSLLPNDLQIDVSQPDGSLSSRLRLVSAREESSPRPDFSGRSFAAPDSDLGDLLARGRQLAAADAEKAQREGIGRAEKALAEGRVLESLLGLLESNLIVSGDPPQALVANRSVFENDPDCQILFQALAEGNSDPIAAARLLETIEDNAGANRHMLQILHGGWLYMADDMLGAFRLYQPALAANPNITGAWKDVGDIQYNRYDMGNAWMCWDVARQLHPQHEMLQQVNLLEERLLSTYPEFF